jgi:ABC-2 type transport system permease protein
MRAVYWVWRRELQVTLRAPIVYVIGGLFLAVQGIAFAGLVAALSDPRRPAPLGALLEGQLAGTLLTWVLQLVVLTLLGMRTIADDKRTGAWELLLTAQVSERAAVVGKWLAAVTIYALLWLPTLAYLVVVGMFRVDDGGWDLASITTGYLGAIALGAALLAWTVAASAATTSTLVAGALGFALLIGLFLVGELPASFPDLAIDHPQLARSLDAISLRGVLTTFARGEVSGSAIAFVAGLAVIGLSLATALACLGRRRRREVGIRAGATAFVAVIAVLSGMLASRVDLRWDVSAARRNSLDSETRGLLAQLPGPAALTIIQPTLSALEPIYDEVERVAERMSDAGPVTVRVVDPASLPGGLAAAARIAGVAPEDLASNGGVVVELGGQRRVVDRLQLVSIARDEQGTAAVESIAVEQAIAGAFAQLTSTVPITACATTGHGELPLDATGHAAGGVADADWRMVADRLRADGITIETLELDREVPARCNVVIVAGPTLPLGAEQAFALQSFVKRGGGLLVAAAARPVTLGQHADAPATMLASTGLEGMLVAEGLGLPHAIAIDPSLTMREMQGSLLIFNGYAQHEINAGFAQARGMIWFQPRVVVTSGAATPLVRASAESWGERDFEREPAKDLDDLAGPITLAALGGSKRVIVVGSAESFMTSLLKGSASAADLWLARAVRFLAGKPAPKVSVAARAPEQVRLVMTSGQRRAVLVLSILGIPLGWIVVGALLLVLRRRRA